MLEDRELSEILSILKLIYQAVRPRLSATLHIHGGKMATILVGKTGHSVWQEFSGPNGTGDRLPTAGVVTYSSSDPAVATVDASSGVVTAIALGTAIISGTDAANNLTATDTVIVTEQAQSAVLTVFPD